MTDYMQRVPLPGVSDMNTGLSPCHEVTMLRLFGRPGALTQDCSALTNRALSHQLIGHKFNNFSVTGWKPAVDSLVRVLTKVYQEKPDLHALVGTAGMLCCRAIRGSTVHYSNHSWGTAIDLTIGGELDQRGAEECHRGILELYPYFHAEGWFWGAEFPTPDSMHFELADETIRKWVKP